MKRLFYFGLILAAFGCIEDPQFSEDLRNAGKPVFNGGAVLVGKTASSIEVSAELEKENGTKITERGLCYGTAASPTIENSAKIKDSGTGKGSYTLTINGLDDKTVYYIRPYAINSAGTEYGDELQVQTNDGRALVKTLPATDIHATSVTAYGEITYQGEGSFLIKGIYYSPVKDWSIKDSVISADPTDEYSCLLTALLPDTLYYLQAFVTNDYGTSTGDIDSVATIDGLGAVETLPATDIHATVVTVGGIVNQPGEGNISFLGVYCSTDKTFAVKDSALVNPPVTSGAYSCQLTNLSPGTKYYIQAFMTNDFGTVTGAIDSLVTISGKGEVQTLKPANIHATSASTGGLIVQPGDGNILFLGVYYSTTAGFAVKDSVLFNPPVTSGNYTCQLTNLNLNTKYYVKAFITNNYGTSTGETDSLTTSTGEAGVVWTGDNPKSLGFTNATFSATANDGGDATVMVVERGFCCATSPSPDINDDTVHCGSGTGLFEGAVTGLIANQRYYVRPYVKSQYGQITYGSDVSFETKDNRPTVSTKDVGTISDGNAEVGGNLIDTGSIVVTDIGICYSTTNTAPDINDDTIHLAIPAGFKGDFSGQLTKLTGGTTYYLRAYATNTNGTRYGETKQFTTPAIFNTGLKKFPGTWRFAGSTAYFVVQSTKLLYILGGDMGASRTNELWYYSIIYDEWQQAASCTVSARWQAATVYGAQISVFGGNDNTNHAIPGMYSYNFNTNTWSDTIAAPDTLYHTAAVSLSNNICFVGGKRDTVKRDVWSYTPGTTLWQKMPDFPVKQYGGIALYINSKGQPYVGMGKDDSDVCNHTIWTSTDNCMTWTVQTVCTISTYDILAGVEYNGNIYVIDANNDILEYDVDNDVWTKKSHLPAGYNNIHCMYACGDKNDKKKIYIGLGSMSTPRLIEYDPTWDN